MTQTPARAALYRAVWRWHFYAGLYVIPFFILLAATGMAMLWIAHIDGRDGERHTVLPQAQTLALSEQAASAEKAFPDGSLAQYIAPRAADLAAIFRINTDDGPMMVVVDPYTAEILEKFPRRSGWYDLMDNLHSSLLLGPPGDRLLELAASLGILLLITGLYLWWPRDISLRRALLPRLGRHGRSFWKSLHAATGLYISLFLLFFLISGLSWAGIWGGKMVQAWSSFPVGKYSGIPLSDITHAEALNGGKKEVPWALEQTPMPASDAHAHHGSGTPIAPSNAPPGAGPLPDLDRIDRFARDIGFTGRYQLNLPQGDTGVWTLSRDSMSTDSLNPTSDRITHIDRYSGTILADIRYADYSLMGKAMAVGIALHMGTLGLWSVLANTLVCLSVIFLCLSGVILWWKRRPAGRWPLAAPPQPEHMPHWPAATAIVLALGLAFPMAGITIAAVLLWDALLRPRLMRRARA
ncbi:PepSY-associated TM helix domain-containing protein [Roseovarius nubinhibens]|uniref:Membrane protein, putative n=1 Tax=Roseovarius nubinhibens (strain ATCC BAA-591 / DSM 15170 / ISM) TaxID=89187 RepID=A3SIC8_ROSNI|nr:PepSY domain-containing protein [Roseovarius nubinhibens]EAP77109.1 membrane protein, putative [Roseovarius nubinhibens ISM]